MGESRGRDLEKQRMQLMSVVAEWGFPVMSNIWWRGRLRKEF